MRDSMIFYRSFYEAIKNLQSDTQAELYDAIFSYGLDFEEPKLNGISLTIWTLIKPQLDANIKRFENGKKPKQKQNESKNEAKDNQKQIRVEANNNVNVNENVNNNKNENVNNFSFRSALISFGFKSELVDEWIKVRKTKKLTNSETAFNLFIKQVELNGSDKNKILEKCVEKSWGGFESDWFKNETIIQTTRKDIFDPKNPQNYRPAL